MLHGVTQFFAHYAQLVSSSNYVTKRQSLKLLGEILLDRTNFKIMTRYIESEDNLKIMMNLLRDKSKNIQFEAFHVFKVGLLDFRRISLSAGETGCRTRTSRDADWNCTLSLLLVHS